MFSSYSGSATKLGRVDPFLHKNALKEYTSVEESPTFVLHRTGVLWWLYEKVKGQYVKIKTARAPATKPGDLISFLVNTLGHKKFHVEVIES